MGVKSIRAARCVLHVWKDFSVWRKKKGSSKMKECCILENPATWNITTPSAFLKLHRCEHLTIKSHSCLKAQPDLLLLRPRSHYLVFWIPDVVEPFWPIVLLVPHTDWVCLQTAAQIFSHPLSLVCPVCQFYRIYSIRPFSPSAVQLVYSWWELQGNMYFKN